MPLQRENDNCLIWAVANMIHIDPWELEFKIEKLFNIKVREYIPEIGMTRGIHTTEMILTLMYYGIKAILIPCNNICGYDDGTIQQFSSVNFEQIIKIVKDKHSWAKFIPIVEIPETKVTHAMEYVESTGRLIDWRNEQEYDPKDKNILAVLCIL